MPIYTLVHSKRICFTDDGKTDSIEYAHFIWQKDNYPEFSKLKVLGEYSEHKEEQSNESIP